MKILQIIDEFGHGGGLERFVYNFSEALLRRGYDTVIAACRIEREHGWGTARLAAETIAGPHDALVLAAQYEPDLVIWHVGEKTPEVVLALASFYKVCSTVHGVICPSGARLFRDTDQICCKQAGFGCLFNWYARKCGTSASPVEAVKAINRHRSMVLALKACTQVYAVSAAVEKFLVIEGISASMIKVFDNTLNGIENLMPVEWPQNGKRIRLLSVGRLVYSKGFQYLLKALPELQAKGYETECTIVGDGWYRGKLEELAAKLGVSEFVRFTGRIAGHQINEWYKRSDVVVVPSIWPDPAPLVVPEARMLGKPVVVFDSGGLPEWAELMDGIFVAGHGSHRSLAESILSVLNRNQNDVPADSPPKRKRKDIIEDISSLCG